MKQFCMMLAAGMIAAGAWAQSGMPSTPPSMKAPSDPGMKAPANTGKIVVPPSVDPGSLATPPRNVDPKIDDATGDIDTKNRKATEDKDKPSKRKPG
jgi:hypothetical protein